MVITICAYKSYPWVIDFSCFSLTFLKSVFFCYVQYQ